MAGEPDKHVDPGLRVRARYRIERWTRFLQLCQQMAEVQRSRLLALHSADEDPSAAYKAVRSPIMDVELSALGLENTDCRSIHF